VTVHGDATLALPILATALASSAGEALAARTRLRFDLAGPVMAVDGQPLSHERFEARP